MYEQFDLIRYGWGRK